MKEEESAKREKIVRTLQDAGCSQELIERFVKFWQEGRRREGLELLREHRRLLLDRCHTEEKRIDCLDYLTYQIEHG